MSEKSSVTSNKVVEEILIKCTNETCAHDRCIPVYEKVLCPYTWSRSYIRTQFMQKTYVCSECLKESHNILFWTMLWRYINYYQNDSEGCNQKFNKSTK